jgi:hypothetical protein
MTPEDVLRNVDLDDENKAKLLCQMAYDAAELAVATDEGMPGDGSDLQRRVLLALHQLHRGIDVEHTAPSKQHGACLRERT